jgi:FlaA1/EpsC-like NDP-sugar epimerase
MGEPIRILDLAHDMIRLSGLRVDEDIEVQIVGLRPGEKLCEELYDQEEVRGQTAHPKIMVADSARRNLLEVIHDIGRLEEVVDQPNEVVTAALRAIIPLHVPPEVIFWRAGRNAAANRIHFTSRASSQSA